MQQAYELNIHGIKCDTEGCTFKDESVKAEEYGEWINRPCPLCGGNLMTKQDYDGVQLLFQITELMNNESAPGQSAGPRKKVVLEFDGTGIEGMNIKDLIGS